MSQSAHAKVCVWGRYPILLTSIRRAADLTCLLCAPTMTAGELEVEKKATFFSPPRKDSASRPQTTQVDVVRKSYNALEVYPITGNLM